MPTHSKTTAQPDLSIEGLIQQNRAEILRLAALHGAHNVRLFGSVVRGQVTADSDLDVLVDFDAGRSLLDRIALIQDLEDLLGIKVDVVTPRSVHQELQSEILQTAQPL
jgi:predicted nucleotidyltransferase